MRIFEYLSDWRLQGLAAAAILVAGYGCASSSQGSASPVVPEGVDLSGTWVLNEEESDSVGGMDRMMLGARGGEGPATGGMTGGRPTGGRGVRPPGGRGGMGGGRGGMRGGAPQGNRIDPEKMRQTMQMAMDPIRRFTISQDDSTVSFITDWQEPLLVRFDGTKLEREYDWGKLSIKAGWYGRGLVVERAVDDGGTVLDRYVLSTTTDQLFVVTRVEVGRMAGEPIEFRKVYDPPEAPPQLLPQ